MSPTESALSSKPSDLSLRATGREGAGRQFALVLYILYCVEIGMFLLVVPWSEVWESNLWARPKTPLMAYFPLLRPLYVNHYVRGAVSGLGVINLWLGVSHAWSFRLSAVRGAAGR